MLWSLWYNLTRPKICIHKTTSICIKTNQMNLRLVRHDEESINNISKTKNSVNFLVEMKDDFGDHGIVSLLMLKEYKEKNGAFLDTFLMSCRVLGRDMESMIFIKLKQDLLKMGYNTLYAKFISGERNTPATKLLDNLNFDVDKHEKNITYYSVDIKSWKINNSNEIKKIYKL